MENFFRMYVRNTATSFVELGIIKELYIRTHVLFVSGNILYSLESQYHFILNAFGPHPTIQRCKNIDTPITIVKYNQIRALYGI